MLAGIRVLGPDDPLGPVDQDADRIRDSACRLVASDSVCSPADPAPARPSSGDAGGWTGLFEMLVWLAFVALVVALVLVIVRVAMTTRRDRRRRAPGGAEEDAAVVEELTPVAIDPPREPSEWRRDAELHRAAGRHRDAVRCRYRALVADLARCGLIDETPGRTSGDERSQMSASAPEEAPAFLSAAELFDGVWFGDLPVADGEVERMAAL